MTPDQPLGIWHYRGHELAPLLSRIRASGQPAVQVLQEMIGEAEALAVSGWMRQMGLIG